MFRRFLQPALLLAAAGFALSVPAPANGADAVPLAPEIIVSGPSVKINGIEVRLGSPPGESSYFSVEAASQALGKAQDNYKSNATTSTFGWPKLGVDLLFARDGFEKGNAFKFHVWFEDFFDKPVHKHSGTFHGKLVVEGVEITTETTFDSLREPLRAKGFIVTEPYVAFQKNRVSLFGDEKTKKIQRLEIWP